MENHVLETSINSHASQIHYTNCYPTLLSLRPANWMLCCLCILSSLSTSRVLVVSVFGPIDLANYEPVSRL
jgi:hypothetical protein